MTAEDSKPMGSPRAAHAPCATPTEQWPQQGKIAGVLGARCVVFCFRHCLQDSSWSYKFFTDLSNSHEGHSKS